MKIENLKRVGALSEVLTAIDAAIKQAEAFISKKKVNASGIFPSGPTNLFNLNISEFGDGSGLAIDLCNCGVGVQIINYALEQLRKQKLVIEKEIESL